MGLVKKTENNKLGRGRGFVKGSSPCIVPTSFPTLVTSTTIRHSNTSANLRTCTTSRLVLNFWKTLAILT